MKRFMTAALTASLILGASATSLSALDTFSTAIEYSRAAKIKKYVDKQNTIVSYVERYIMETGDLTPTRAEVKSRFGIPSSLFTNLSGQGCGNTACSDRGGVQISYNPNTHKITLSNNSAHPQSLPAMSKNTYLRAPNRNGLDMVNSSTLAVDHLVSPETRRFTYFVQQLRARGNAVSLGAPSNRSLVWYKPDGSGSFEVFKNDGRVWQSLGEMGSLLDSKQLVLDSTADLNGLPGIPGMKVSVKEGASLMSYVYVNDADKWMPEGTNANVDIGDELPVDMTGTAWVSGDGSGSICTKSKPCTCQMVRQKKDLVQILHFTGVYAGSCGDIPKLIEVYADAGAGGVVSTAIGGVNRAGEFKVENSGALNVTFVLTDAGRNTTLDVKNTSTGRLALRASARSNTTQNKFLTNAKIVSEGMVTSLDVDAVTINAEIGDADRFDGAGKIINLVVNGDVRHVVLYSLYENLTVNGHIDVLSLRPGSWYYTQLWEQMGWVGGGPIARHGGNNAVVNNNGSISVIDTDGYKSKISTIVNNKGSIESMLIDSYNRQCTNDITVVNDGRLVRKKNLYARLRSKRIPGISAIHYAMFFSSAYSNDSRYPGGSSISIVNNGSIEDKDTDRYHRSMFTGRGGSVSGFKVSINNRGTIRNDAPNVTFQRNLFKNKVYSFSGSKPTGYNINL